MENPKRRSNFTHPRLTLIEDTVVLPDQTITKYLKFKRTGHVATVIGVREDGFIPLQREYSHPPGEVLYQFPAGSVPNEEDIAEGANREFMEECGLRGDLELIGNYYSENHRTDSKTYVFVATNLHEAALPADAEEFIEYDWYSEAMIDEMMVAGKLRNAYVIATWAVFKSWRAKQRKS